VGVMGKGIALQFRKAYPRNYEAYKRACDVGEVQPGRMFVFDQGGVANPRYIINFPTKRHWRQKSRMEDVEAGLVALVEEVRRLGIQSIAVPPLGCGHGGLPWSEVFPRMREAFETLPDVHWVVFEPAGAPAPKEMKNRTKRPRMTPGRAALIGMIDRYLVPGFDYPISLLEVQKLIYFLTAAGEHLERVIFKRHHYGPYADVLRHVLDRMEGHLISGFGDGNNKPDTPLSLLPKASLEANKFLEDQNETLEHMSSVTQLIEGYETPYGMELLSTVHWVSTQESAHDPGEALEKIRSWNPRKAELMKPEHVRAAWERLEELGWLAKRAAA